MLRALPPVLRSQLHVKLHRPGLALPLSSCPGAFAAASRVPQSPSVCPAGSTKLVVQAVEVRDVLGRFGKASGLDAGVILSTWNPDAGWEKDALVSHLRSSAIILDMLPVERPQQAAAGLQQQACQEPGCLPPHPATEAPCKMRHCSHGECFAALKLSGLSEALITMIVHPITAAGLLQQPLCSHCGVIPQGYDLTKPLHHVAPGLHLLHHACLAHELPPAVQVRVTILVGTPTTTHTVYESVDVMVHPLGVHLTEAVASSIWVSCCFS